MADRFSELEVMQIEEEYPYSNTKELARDLVRKPKAIEYKARRLGIKKINYCPVCSSVHYGKKKICDEHKKIWHREIARNSARKRYREIKLKGGEI